MTIGKEIIVELLDPWPGAPRYWPPARGEE